MVAFDCPAPCPLCLLSAPSLSFILCFQGLKIFFFIVGGIYLLYLIILIVKAYFELRNMPYFGKS